MRSVDMPILAKLRNVSSYSRIVRYANSFHSSRRYLTRDGNCVVLRKKAFCQSFRTLQQTFDRNLPVFIGGNRNYGRLARVHVNKTRNMSSEHGESEFNSSQKENDDLSLPFWIFLWSFLAIFAGFIYSKLNRQRDDDSEQKSEVQFTTNDEQIARKLVNEISKKDSGRTPFKRQRSYEIIDGEVRIHYDVTMLEDSLHKRANTERILELSEVESIPIPSTSLEDLEFVYPGSLPRIVEEGEEELLGNENEEKTPLKDGRVYLNEGKPEVNQLSQETKNKKTQINTAKVSNQVNSDQIADKFEANGLHLERGMDDFIASTFETVTQETFIIPAESIKDANKIPIILQKDNDTEFIKKDKDIGLENEMTVDEHSSSSDELRSTSGGSVIIKSSGPTRSTNSLNNLSTSVYKMTEVQKTPEHKYTVTRREVTKLKSSKECLGESDSLNVETSFSFVEAEGIQETAVNDGLINGEQKSLENDSSMSHPDIQVTTESQFNSDKNVKEDLGGIRDSINEGRDILVDNSGDNLFKVTGASDGKCLGDVAEYNGFVYKEKNNDNLDENENYGIYSVKNDLTDRSRSFPSYESVHGSTHSKLESTKIGNCDDKKRTGLENDKTLNNVRIDNSSKLENNKLEQVFNQSSDNVLHAEDVTVDLKYSQKNSAANAPSPNQNDNFSEASLPMVDNRIGSRKTIFVKDNQNIEHEQEEAIMETSFDDSRKAIPKAGFEEAAMFAGMQNENNRPESLESEISGEIVILEAYEMNEVDEDCSASREDDDQSENADVFARADLLEEDVLVAKIVTMQIPDAEDVAKIVTMQIHGAEDVDVSSSSCQSVVDSCEETVMSNFQGVFKQVLSQTDFTEQNKPTFTNSDLTEEIPAKASLQEENVLLAKVITFEEPGSDIHLASSDMENCETISPADIQTSSEPKFTVSTKIDATTTQNIFVNTDVIEPETIITSTSTKMSHTEVTSTTVISVVKKSEVDENLGHNLQTENNHSDLNCDIHDEATIWKQTNDGEVENQLGESSLGRKLDKDFVQSFEANDEHTSEQTLITSAAENKEIIASDINGINDDRPFSSEAHLSIVDKDQQVATFYNPDVESIQDLPTNASSIECVKEINKISEIDPHSNNFSSSKDQVNYSENSVETNHFLESIEENYDNHITELEPSPSHSLDEEKKLDDTAELICAITVDDDVIMPKELTEVSKTDENVIYANQICETEEFADTLIAENYSNQASDGPRNTSRKDSRGSRVTTVVYASQVCESEKNEELQCEAEDQSTDSELTKVGKNEARTTVTYSNHLNETQEIVENISPSKETEHNQNTNMDSSVSPHLNNEERNFLETSLDSPSSPSSPVETFSPREQQDDVVNFDNKHGIPDSALDKVSSDVQEVELLLLSSNEPNKASSELRTFVPRSETDVDYFSDIDEIDIDVLPEEKCQKSKSVTDLDEALASFKGLDYLPNENDNINGGLSKSVPDIIDSCREESLKKEGLGEKFQKKTLSLSTPEIGSPQSGSKKVTKIKIVHVKFLEMQDEGESVEEDSFIYEGELPITGKMKRRSKNLSDEMRSPVSSPPPGVSNEIAQERWIAEKTSLKQLEFEFGDLFQSSSPPPVLGANESSTDGHNQALNNEKIIDIPKFPNYSIVRDFHEGKSSSETDVRASDTSDNRRSLLAETNNTTFRTNTTTDSSKFETNDQRVPTKQTASPTIRNYETSNAASYCNISTDKPLDMEKASKEIISARLVVTESATKTTNETARSYQSSTNTSLETKIRHKTTTQGSSSITESERPKKISRTTDSGSGPRSTVECKSFEDMRLPISSRSTTQPSTDSIAYRYIPGNTNSYSKAPKPVPEHAKYVVKSGMIAAQSPVKQTNTGNISNQARYGERSSKHVAKYTENTKSSRSTQVRYTGSPQSSSPMDSPRHGLKLSEKFRISEENDLERKSAAVPGIDGSTLAGCKTDTNQRTDGPKNKKLNHRGSYTKATSQHGGGRLVTVKGGIISDYECSSDADSEMSYNVPSPRVKAKRFHRPQVQRVDSASSSEPDSPRIGAMKEERRSMSELFGVDEATYSSDVSKDGKDENLLSGFGKKSDERKTSQTNQTSSNVYQAKGTIFDQRQQGFRNFNVAYDTRVVPHHQHYTNNLERNLSPTSFLQEGNLDDQTSPKTIEFNPFEDLEGRDILQPFERCHSPSSVYSDTSSVFSFNCDFDPMPPPAGKFEPEVYTCENPMCRKQDILLGPEKTSFKSCPACFTYYCSSECRKLHWPSHKQSCYFGRVNTYVRSIIRLCQRREDLSMYLSQLARDGYKKKGRGVVMAIFNSPELAREFITKGHDAFSGRKPTYSSLAELNREGIISKHRVALMQAVRDYEPNEEFVFNIAVVATNSIPVAPAPRYKLNTVLHCIKMPLNDLIVARQPKDYEKVETRLFALPKCSRHEFVNEMEARRHYCRNLSKNLRQYNIKLKEDYPECYKKLCMYVEHNISFEPMTVYGQRSGLGYKCVIAPEQSYPLNAEYC
ncbi:uncharacterized protein LOC114533594 [Dendronephthya gigantea]|uniref:uncharacterized protein LOC114533594 n=1 Tax=Dendronephthya gigantea TaxID=151771 RepID=UPI00106B1C2F|nr:uncharacterized protein LOC114533594 [Dendronephthya gigantea]